jgi:hypothetical protein
MEPWLSVHEVFKVGTGPSVASENFNMENTTLMASNCRIGTTD